MNKKVSTLSTINPQELAEKGSKIYDQMHSNLEKSHWGEFVAIEVDSGKYFIDKTDIEALMKARRQFPDKVFYMVKVGSQAVIHFSSGQRPLSYGSVL